MSWTYGTVIHRGGWWMMIVLRRGLPGGHRYEAVVLDGPGERGRIITLRPRHEDWVVVT